MHLQERGRELVCHDIENVWFGCTGQSFAIARAASGLTWEDWGRVFICLCLVAIRRADGWTLWERIEGSHLWVSAELREREVEQTRVEIVKRSKDERQRRAQQRIESGEVRINCVWERSEIEEGTRGSL